MIGNIIHFILEMNFLQQCCILKQSALWLLRTQVKILSNLHYKPKHLLLALKSSISAHTGKTCFFIFLEKAVLKTEPIFVHSSLHIADSQLIAELIIEPANKLAQY